MKLIPNQSTYLLPENIGLLKSVCKVNNNGLRIPLFLANDHKEIFKEKQKSPHIIMEPFCFIYDRNEISFYPTPDKEYEVEIKYYPPMKIL